MKKLKATLIALAILVGSTVSAANLPTDDKVLTPSEEIGVLLENPEFLIKQEQTAKVKFMLNENNELVIISVKTDDSEVEKFVKSRLNYQKLEATLPQEHVYDIDIRLVSGD